MANETSKPRPRLLFVDDEQRVLNSMRIMFRRDFELYLASRGVEALKIIRDKDIDVIVADHRMPQMTGVEVLARVRAESPRTVRILLTGYADLDAVEGSINEGEVFRFLTKPCPPAQLKETVMLAARLARASPAGGADKPHSATPNPLARPARPAAGNLSGRPTANPHGTPRVAPPPAGGPPPRAAVVDPLASTGSFDPVRTSVLENPTDAASSRPVLSRGMGVIVFSTDEHVLETVQHGVRGRLPVYGATNIVKVVKLLTQHQPGVLVTDVSTDRATIQAMTSRLKQHLPELVTIAVSEHRDVLDMVWLINHGQIFRFLRKPLSPGRCAVCLQAALKHHRALLDNPELVKRHEVDKSEDAGGVMDSMLAKIRQVRRLWASV